MVQTFDDLCTERERYQGAKMLSFTLWAIVDTSIGILKEHLRLITNTMKTTPIATIGLVLLIPFSIIFGVGMVWQFLHNIGYASLPDVGILVPNKTIGFAIVFTLPIIAFLINAITLILGAVTVGSGSILSMQFVKANFFSLTIVVSSAGATLFAFGHDSIPCFVHGVIREGVGNIWQLIQTCSNA